MSTHLFSDASLKDGLASVAVHLVDSDGCFSRSRLISERDSVRAELTGILHGLSLCREWPVTVHSDLSEIHGILEGTVSYSEKLADLTQRLREFPNVTYVADARDWPEYHRCHKSARQVISRAKKRGNE